MIINFISHDDDPNREEKIKRLLPATPFRDSIVLPALWKFMLEPLTKALLAEIEVYRAFPKRGKFDMEIFNPRNNKTCFMGLGFKGNDHWTDAELQQYRKAVGTYHHKVWGDKVTLLEIWGGDHFEKYPKMVKGVFEYAFDKRKELPKVEFKIMPLVITADTGTPILNEEQEAEQRAVKLAQQNELRRQYNLPASDYLAEEIEDFKKAGNWDDVRKCPKNEDI